jgi:glutamate decarboxylase
VSESPDPKAKVPEVPIGHDRAFMVEPAPERTIPDEGMSSRAALETIQSEVILDGDPEKNLATFVTTWMEPEARMVIAENLHRNYIDHAEYPRTAEISKRCVRMLHNLYHGEGEPECPGAACAGSSEAVMLGALAMKWRWRERRKKDGKPVDRPNLVYGADVHVVWDKFCRYFDVEPRQVPVPKGKTVVSVEDVAPHIDENTIGVVAVAGTTFTGECDDLAGIDAHLNELAGKGMEVPMHVDAASGGFVFPFSDPDFEWDFRLKSVKSINTSGHKFGLVYPGIGWLVFRDDDQLPDDLVFYEDYLGEKDPTFTLNFSGSSSFILAQYFNFMRLGKSGYGQLVGVMNHNRATLSEAIEATGSLELVRGSGPVIPLVICKVKEGEVFTENELVAELARRRGWLVPAYQMPPDNEDQRIIRMLVKINQTRELVEALANDFTDSIEMLKTRGPVSHGPPPSHSATGY